MASEDVQTNLRLPAALKERLTEAAAEHNRSLSAEVAFRLQQSFDTDKMAKQLALAEYKLEQLARIGSFDGDVRLSPAILSIVEHVAEENQIPLGDALAMLALAGYGKGSPAVIYFAAEPNFTAGGYIELFKALEGRISPDTTIVIDHSGVRVQVRSDPQDSGQATEPDV